MSYLLIITEDRAVGYSLRMILKDSFLVEESSFGEASAVVASRRPDVIFLDDRSRGDSLEVLASLLRQEPSLTIISLVPSLTCGASVFLEHGAFDLLEKPFTAEQVKQVVSRALERERLLAENRQLKSMGREEPRRDHLARENEIRTHDFYKRLLQTISETLGRPEQLPRAVVVTLRQHFRFNPIAFFTSQSGIFKVVASCGLDENLIRQLQVPSSHSLISWFLKKRSLLRTAREANLSGEIYSLSELLGGQFFFPLLTTRGSLSGFLSLGGKLTGEETTREELGLLSLVCDYLTAIQENLQLTQEINLQAGYQEAILGSIPTGIVAVDMRGRVTIMNRSAERITGVRAEEVQGQSVETLGSQIADFLRRALRGDEVSRIELTYVPTKAVLGISTRTLQHGEEFQGAVAAFQDLTEVKKMDRERAEVERNRYWNTVAARLSHELKNPLVAIKTFAQMLPLKYEDSEFRSGFAQIVQQEIAKLNRIIEGINRLAEPLNLTVAPVHLLELLNSVGQGIAECPAGKLEVKCAEPFDDLMLADALRLREAFGYILQFCWRDNRGEKPVLCSVKADNQTVTVEYREEGSTLALPSGEEIFLPFVSTLESNLSIGLVLAKKIVEAHEGRMELVTEGNSRKFVITLSLKRDEKNLSGG